MREEGASERVVVGTRDVARALALLGEAVESSVGERLVVVSDDPARVNARLVSAGVRVDSVGPLRVSLEDVVLRASEAS